MGGGGRLSAIEEGADDDADGVSGRSQSTYAGSEFSSALSNASTCASSELWLARSETEEEALRGLRARKSAASRHMVDSSPPRERLVAAESRNAAAGGALGGGAHLTPGASCVLGGRSGPSIRFPTPRPTESLASRMAQQRR